MRELLSRISSVIQKQSPDSVFQLSLNKGDLSEQVVSEIEAKGRFTADDLERLREQGVHLTLVYAKSKPNPLEPKEGEK